MSLVESSLGKKKNKNRSVGEEGTHGQGMRTHKNKMGSGEWSWPMFLEVDSYVFLVAKEVKLKNPPLRILGAQA